MASHEGDPRDMPERLVKPATSHMKCIKYAHIVINVSLPYAIVAVGLHDSEQHSIHNSRGGECRVWRPNGCGGLKSDRCSGWLTWFAFVVAGIILLSIRIIAFVVHFDKY